MSISIEDVSVRLGTICALEHVSCAFPGRAISALLGPNGAGKSTLLKAIAGLLPLAGGRITLDGSDVAWLDRRELARRIAYLPQERTVSWPLSVRDVVALGRIPHGARLTSLSSRDTAAIDEALARLDLAALADRPINALSGGERGRVLIARALAQDAEVLIADEPVAGLDPAAQLALAGVLADLARSGRTVITALHDLSLARRTAHCAVLLARGRVVATGAIETCLQPEPILRCFGLSVEIATIAGVPLVVPVAPAT